MQRLNTEDTEKGGGCENFIFGVAILLSHDMGPSVWNLIPARPNPAQAEAKAT